MNYIFVVTIQMPSSNALKIETKSRKRKRVVVRLGSSIGTVRAPLLSTTSSSTPSLSLSSPTLSSASTASTNPNSITPSDKSSLSIRPSHASTVETSVASSVSVVPSAVQLQLRGGNWPTHIFIEVAVEEHANANSSSNTNSLSNNSNSNSTNITFEELYALTQPIIHSRYASLPLPIEFLPSPLHMSLSRTAMLKTSEIDPFIRALRLFALEYHHIHFTVDSVSIFTNELRSRSFFAFLNHNWLTTLRQEQNQRILENRRKDVKQGCDNNVVSFINDLNELMNEYELPSYYKHIVPHLSFAMYKGDLTSLADPVYSNKEDAAQENSLVSQSEEDYNNLYTYGNDLDGTDRLSIPLNTCCTISVRRIYCTIGNRIYECPLQSRKANPSR